MILDNFKKIKFFFGDLDAIKIEWKLREMELRLLSD